MRQGTARARALARVAHSSKVDRWVNLTGTPSPKVYLRGQHYYVDLPEAYTKLRYGASGERMLLCTLTRTLIEQKGQDVTFLVAGQNVEALGRMDLTQPFTASDCADE